MELVMVTKFRFVSMTVPRHVQDCSGSRQLDSARAPARMCMMSIVEDLSAAAQSISLTGKVRQ